MTVTLEDIVYETRRIALEEPDHVYTRLQRCTNLQLDEASGDLVGSCIIGKAMLAAGVPLGLIAEHNGAGFRVLAAALGFDSYAPEANWLDRVQASQERRLPWGEAVSRADLG